jgi:CxxC-x17-CxxC domain-containing protein
MPYEDKVIVCEDCRTEFTHTAEDQARYAERGFAQDPKRCRECRQARKDRSAAQKARGPRHGGPGRGGRPERRRGPAWGAGRGEGGAGQPTGGGGFEAGFGGAAESHEAICAACGRPTTVPFKPTPGRQVYCRECYRALRQS